MLYNGGVLTNLGNQLFYEVHDEIEGLDLVVDRIKFSMTEMEDLRAEIKKLSDHAPSNARVKLTLKNVSNGRFMGTIKISSYYFHHEKTFYSSDHLSLIKDIFNDSYFTLKKWNKYRSLAMN